MSFVAALLPVVLYIFAVYQIDKFSLVSVKGLVLLVVSGMAAALACFGLFLLTGPLLTEQQSAFLDPLVEEAVKALPLLILACRKKMVFFIDSVICGAARFSRAVRRCLSWIRAIRPRRFGDSTPSRLAIRHARS